MKHSTLRHFHLEIVIFCHFSVFVHKRSSFNHFKGHINLFSPWARVTICIIHSKCPNALWCHINIITPLSLQKHLEHLCWLARWWLMADLNTLPFIWWERLMCLWLLVYWPLNVFGGDRDSPSLFLWTVSHKSAERDCRCSHLSLYWITYSWQYGKYMGNIADVSQTTSHISNQFYQHLDLMAPMCLYEKCPCSVSENATIACVLIHLQFTYIYLWNQQNGFRWIQATETKKTLLIYKVKK